jgi:hypothetical protein
MLEGMGDLLRLYETKLAAIAACASPRDRKAMMAAVMNERGAAIIALREQLSNCTRKTASVRQTEFARVREILPSHRLIRKRSDPPKPTRPNRRLFRCKLLTRRPESAGS